MSLFTKVKDPQDLEKLIQQRRSLMNEANNKITLAAAGRTEDEFKSAKQVEKNLAPLTSLTKEVIDQLKLQTEDLEAIKQAAARPQLPGPNNNQQALPPKDAQIEELYPDYESKNPFEVFLQGFEKKTAKRGKMDAKDVDGKYFLNDKPLFLVDDKVALEGGKEEYPMTKGLAFLLSGPFDEFKKGSPKARIDQFKKLKADVTEEDVENYKEILDETGYVYSGGPKPKKLTFIEKKMGKGVSGGKLIPQKKSRPYRVEKVDDKLVFGDLTIDAVPLFSKMMLHAYDSSGKLAVKAKIDASFIDLLTKRFNTNKLYSQAAKKAFKKLMLASKLEPNMSSAKYKWLYDDMRGGKIDAVSKASVMGYTLDELVDRLPILFGELDAGNNSQLIYNEATRILDILLNKGAISKTEHKGFFNKLMSFVRSAASKI